MEEKIRQMELDCFSAKEAAADGKIEEWVHKYLNSGTGGQTNKPFSESLKRAQRWWRGPLEVDLAELAPAVGSDPTMEYVVAPDDWQAWTSDLAKTFTSPQALPPLIVEYRSGELSIRDGNTRFGAMQFLGWPKCWVVIWYNSEQDYQKHADDYPRYG